MFPDPTESPGPGRIEAFYAETGLYPVTDTSVEKIISD
jgi:hypothetical protein